MPAQYVTSIVEGQDFYVADIDPTGVVSAVRGSLCLRVDSGNALVYLNTTVANSAGTTWVPLLATDLTDITQLTLAANANPALQIGPAALASLLKFITTTGAAQLSVNTSQAALLLTGNNGITFSSASGVTNILAPGGTALYNVGANAQSQAASPDGVAAVVTAIYSYVAFATSATTDITLANTRTLRIIDAAVISPGAGGTVQLQTAAGALNTTDAMVPSATIGGITRAAQVINATRTAGAVLRIATTAGALAGQVRVVYEVV